MWLTHAVLLGAHSLHNGALFHGKPYPVLALGPIALPVGVRIAVCQAGHIELLLGRGREVESVFTPTPCTGGVLWAREHERKYSGAGLEAHLVWVEASRGSYMTSKMGGWTEYGLWGFRFGPGLEVRVLDLARCDYILLGAGGVPAPTV